MIQWNDLNTEHKVNRRNSVRREEKRIRGAWTWRWCSRAQTLCGPRSGARCGPRFRGRDSQGDSECRSQRLQMQNSRSSLVPLQPTARTASAAATRAWRAFCSELQTRSARSRSGTAAPTLSVACCSFSNYTFATLVLLDSFNCREFFTY